MSLNAFRTDLELEAFEEMILTASEQEFTHSSPSRMPLSRSRRLHLPTHVLVLLIALVLLTAGAAVAVNLSKGIQYRGHLEVNKLLLTAFDHIPNDGGPGPVNFFNETASGFNFSVLNRWKGSIDYNLSFDIQSTFAAITNVSGVLVQYRVDVNGSLVDNVTFPISWTLIPDNHVIGIGPTFTSVQLPNDAGEQFFRADITLTFELNSQFSDGVYVMVVTCVPP